jgi:hypothetical protein
MFLLTDVYNSRKTKKKFPEGIFKMAEERQILSLILSTLLPW